MKKEILKLDRQGQPQDWISRQDAIMYHAKNLVAFQIGDEDFSLFRGGDNRLTGTQSMLKTAPIIAVKGEKGKSQKFLNRVPSLTNANLFARDRYTCAYCGKIFSEDNLTRDHIIPVSRHGKDVWTNVVAACKRDNHYKDDRLLEEIGMELLYVPYTPSHAEKLILEGRTILPVQAEYLAQFIPEASRAHRILEELQLMH